MTEDSYIDPDWIALQMHEANKLRFAKIKKLLARRGIGVADHVHSSLTTIDMLLTFGVEAQWPLRFTDDARLGRSVAIMLRVLPNVHSVLLHHTNMKTGDIMLLPDHTVFYWSVRIGWEANAAHKGINDPYPVIGGSNPRYDRPRYISTASDSSLTKYPSARTDASSDSSLITGSHLF